MWLSCVLKNLLIEFWTKAFHIRADSVKWSQIRFWLLLVYGVKWEYTAWLLPSGTSLKNTSCICMYWTEGSFFLSGERLPCCEVQKEMEIGWFFWRFCILFLFFFEVWTATEQRYFHFCRCNAQLSPLLLLTLLSFSNKDWGGSRILKMTVRPTMNCLGYIHSW